MLKSVCSCCAKTFFVRNGRNHPAPSCHDSAKSEWQPYKNPGARNQLKQQTGCNCRCGRQNTPAASFAEMIAHSSAGPQCDHTANRTAHWCFRACSRALPRGPVLRTRSSRPRASACRFCSNSRRVNGANHKNGYLRATGNVDAY